MPRSPRMEGYFSFDRGIVTESHILSGGDGSFMSMDNFDISRKEGLTRRKGAVLRSTVSKTLTVDDGNGGPVSLNSIQVTGSRIIDVHNKSSTLDTPYERALALSTNIGTLLLLVDRDEDPLADHLEITPTEIAKRIDVLVTSEAYNTDTAIASKGIIAGVVQQSGSDLSVNYVGYEEQAAELMGKVSVNQVDGMRKHVYGDSVTSIDGVVVGTIGMGISALLEGNINFSNSSLMYRDFKIQSDVNSDAELSPSSDKVFIDRIIMDLLNQGWTISQVRDYQNRFKRYPSLAMSPIDAYDTDKDGKEFWNSEMFDTKKYQRTTSTVARGSRILKQAHGVRSELDTIDDDSGLYLTCAEEHGGRLWYAGHRNLIFYSKTLMPSPKIRDLALCHSENDPTSRYDNDPLPTDGGYVSIPGGGNFMCMRDFLGNLVVFGRNGVWTITGSDNSSVVDPQDITVSKISNTGPINQGSIVVGDNTIYYFTKGGVHAIVPHQETGQLYTTNISDNVFESYYRSISESEKLSCFGSYSEEYGKISWAMIGGDTIRIVMLDTLSGALYPYSVYNKYGYSKIIPYPDKSIKEVPILQNVMVGSEDVYVGLDNVYVVDDVETRVVELDHPFLYVGIKESHTKDSLRLDMGLVSFDNPAYMDWDDVEYLSFVETSYDSWDNPASHKDLNTLFVWMDSSMTFTDVEEEDPDDGEGDGDNGDTDPPKGPVDLYDVFPKGAVIKFKQSGEDIIGMFRMEGSSAPVYQKIYGTARDGLYGGIKDVEYIGMKEDHIPVAEFFEGISYTENASKSIDPPIKDSPFYTQLGAVFELSDDLDISPSEIMYVSPDFVDSDGLPSHEFITDFEERPFELLEGHTGEWDKDKISYLYARLVEVDGKNMLAFTVASITTDKISKEWAEYSIVSRLVRE